MTKKICKAAPYIVLGASILVLIILNIAYHDHWLDSDMAAEMIFSKQISEEGGLIASSSWYYSTEFRILYTQLVMVPLFHIFGKFHLIRSITNVVTYVLMLVGFFYFMKPLKIKKEISVTVSALLLLPFSETMITHMTMGNTYMPHVIIMLFWMGMLFRLSGIAQTSIPKWRYVVLAVLFGLLSLICGMSGVRYFLCIFAPICLASLIFAYVNRNAKFKILYVSVVGAVLGAIGYAINIIFIAKAYVFQTYESTNFITIFNGILLERIQNTFGKIMDFFGYIPERGLLSARGMITIMAFLMLAVVSGITVCMRRNYFGLLTICSFFINIFVFIFTDGTVVARYFIPVFVMWIPAFAYYIQGNCDNLLLMDADKIKNSDKLNKTVVLAIFACCIVVTSAKVLFSFVTVDKNKELKKVSSFLQNEGLDFGYATYWNGNIVNELSDGKIEIANIGNPDSLEFFTWSSPSKYYDDAYKADQKVFLLLESSQADEYIDSVAVKKGDKVYDTDGYVIYLYDSKDSLLACSVCYVAEE